MKIFNTHIRVPFIKQTEIFKEENIKVIAETIKPGCLRLSAYQDNERFKIWTFEGDGLIDFRSLGATNQTKVAKYLLNHGVYHRTALIDRGDLRNIYKELNLGV